jgi:hypothetical protein
MTKKRAPKQKKSFERKPFKIIKQQNSSKKFREIKPNLQTEARNLQTQKQSQDKVSQKNNKEKESIFNYYIQSLDNVFYTYSGELLAKYLEREKIKENLAQTDEKILSKFNITKELRKFSFKYLLEVLKNYNIRGKLYFKTVSLFDYFLELYSKNHSTEECSMFLLSKHNNHFSKSKLILFTLCCFFIINQNFNSQNFELRCLEKWDDENELNYEELNDLVYTILKEVDFYIDILDQYDFLNLFLFDLNKKLKIVTNDNTFINFFNQCVTNFSIKMTQDISLNDVMPSAQSFGVIMFSLEYSKFMMKQNFRNDNANFIVENWIKKVKNIFANNESNDIKRVIHWLNNYVNTH